MGYFAKKIVLVYGAETAIGRRIAPALAAEGARLVLAGPSQGALQNVSQAVGAHQVHWDCEFLAKCREDDLKDLVRRTWNRFRRVDVLVNCMSETGGLTGARNRTWDEAMSPEARCFLTVLEESARRMAEQGHGQILNAVPMPDPFLPYQGTAARFHALLAVTRSERLRSFGRGVKVQFFAPLNMPGEEGARDAECFGQFEPELHMPRVLEAMQTAKLFIVEPLQAWALWNMLQLVPMPLLEKSLALKGEVDRLYKALSPGQRPMDAPPEQESA